MSKTEKTAYDFAFESLKGEPMPLSAFAGRRSSSDSSR